MRLERMEEQGIARRIVEAVVAAAQTVIRGDTADEYDADVEHRRTRVVVARRDPPLVTPEDWQLTLEVNLTGVWQAMRAEIAHLLEQGGGAIVNVASIYGVVGSASSAAYTASKHGVVGLTRSAALQYAARSIRINAVCPGHSHTPMTAALLADPAWLPRRLARYPMGRLAQPEETAELVRWLCSDAASFVTGQALPVDGGYTAQ